MDDIIAREGDRQLTAQVGQMMDLLRRMAVELTKNREETEALKKELRLMVTLSRAQEKELTDLIGARAAEIMARYRLEKGMPEIKTAIRKSLRQLSGVNALRDMPRCDMEIYKEAVRLWDDWSTIKKIREARK